MGDVGRASVNDIQNASSLKAIIPHVLLLKNLPQDGDIEDGNVESALLKTITHFTQNTFSGEEFGENGIPKTTNTMLKWEKLQSQLRTTFSLNTDLSQLQEGDSTVIYVRGQNCTILFTRVDELHMRIMTFRASFPNQEIMSTVGSLKATYPETAGIVPISQLLLSPTFSRHVQNLSLEACDLAMPKSQKGGHIFSEMRQVSNPFVVSEFIIGMLQPISQNEYNEHMQTRIKIKTTKKVRDEINWGDSLIPFRRSGLWMSAKVVLQLNLQEELGNEEARPAFKVILLEMITHICKTFCENEPKNWDILSQMMVKLARRSKKLSELGPSSNPKFERARKSVLEQAFKTIEEIHLITHNAWRAVELSEDSEVIKIFRSSAEFESDIQHEMTELNEYLEKVREPNESGSLVNLKELQFSRYNTLQELLKQGNVLQNSSKSMKDPHWKDSAIWIYDVELFTRTKLTVTESPKDIYSLLCNYSLSAKLYAEKYGDPVSFCRMILTVMRMIMTLDAIAVNAHPLLNEHKSGIDPKLFERLLLPHNQEEMGELSTLENYFNSRNATSSHPSIIHCGNISDSSFSVRYAAGSPEMMTLKAQILADMASKIEQKKNEVRVAKQECQEMQNEINRMTCSTTWHSYLKKFLHSHNCDRCEKLDRLEQKRKSVSYYQRLLPNVAGKEYFAVVFEMLLPEEIAFLRNGLAIFLEKLCGQTLFNFTQNDMRLAWTSFTDLRRFVSQTKAGYANEVKLGSKTKSVMDSHYARSNQNLDVMSAHEDNFIRDNGLSLNFFFESRLDFQLSEEHHRFQVRNTLKPEPYANLEFSLKSSRPTENEVISLQYKCHQKLLLKEYIAYGSMRSGPRIQLRNLYAAIANQTISLEQEPVFALILQTIWEVGPRTTDNLREIHADFYEKTFSLEFLELLENILKSNSTNWSCPMVIMTIIVITIRILELNENHEVREHCTKILKQTRIILESWWQKMEDIILNSEGSAGSTNDIAVLNRLLIQSALCSAFTFNVSSPHLMPTVISDEKDVTFWLRTVARMYRMVVREKAHESCSKFTQNLVRHARLQISLNVESYLVKQLSREILHEFSSSQWISARTSRLTPGWCQYHDNSHSKTANIYSLEYQDYQDNKLHNVHIDILRGVFLVDGYPPSYLPENIMQHPLFNIFFQHCRFRVQRDSRTFRTLNQYEDNHYEFYFTKQGNNTLSIRELHENYAFELLPPDLFEGHMSSHFICNFTHWLHTKTNEVYFRPKAKILGNSSNDPKFILIPNGEKMLLKKYPLDPQSHNFVLSIKSHGFKNIVSNLRKLEISDFIDITMEKTAAAVKIYANVRRFNLTFELENKDGLLYSLNFPGFYVSANQCFGTFTGLQSGLLLEKKSLSDVSGFKKIFLIQHGHVRICKKSNKSHQMVSIDSTTLRKPPMFTFEVDEILLRLKAGNDKSAWLYLAALHASTSSPFPDTFTKLTGTEMAMWILQSGLVWSCSPYDKESLSTLQMIKNLSPKRVYYPDQLQEMQRTSWPVGLELNSYAAYDGYSIVVDYLINCSNRLKGLFPDSAEGLKQTTLNNAKCLGTKLTERAYCRYINLYNKCAQLVELFFGQLNHSSGLRRKQRLESFSCGSSLGGGWMELAKVRMLGLPHFLPHMTYISSIIMTSEMLPCDTNDTLSGGTFNLWFSTDFRENWLRLYALALSVNQQPALKHEFSLLLGALLYSKRVTLEHVLNLHHISCLPLSSSYEFPPVIRSTCNFTPTSNSCVPTEIESILKTCAKDFPQRENDFTTHEDYLTAQRAYIQSRDSALQNAKVPLINQWPAPNVELESIRQAISSEYANLDQMRTKISSQFAFWFNNRELQLFVEKVDAAMKKAASDGTRERSTITATALQNGALNFHCIEDKSDRIEIPLFLQPLESILFLQRLFSTGKTKMEQRQECVKLFNMITKNLQDFSCFSETGKAFTHAGMHLRLAPLVLLRYLLNRESTPEDLIRDHAGALAVLFTHLRRLNRIIYFERDPETYSVVLERETKNKPFDNWSPKEYPEWLLLELELDVTIRAVQVRVAKHMINMTANGKKNGVTQLNMGEGKTSVIVPMIVSALSSNQDMLCRVTVMSSIFTTNFSLLSFTIGGLLNRRLYTIPCLRDYKISGFLPQIQQTYEECMKQKGVIMTLPEYRLSFRLMMYNYYLQNKYEFALQVYNIEKWLREHARDIVDESDEIFSVKYQLIYTTGHQLNIDGGNMRWVVCQKLLQILPQVASQLFDKFGPNVVEFSKEEATSNSEQFTHFRILDIKCRSDFHELLADAILDGKVDLLGIILKEQDRALVKAFLVDENISEDEHKTFVNWSGIDEEQKLVLLLVSGYLRRGIFFAAFSKRWRVECGVNDKGDKLMAVPFRAKDVAAERTEFGHPDIAIVLTQLSYYYSGLNDEQLYEAFAILRTMAGPEKDYNSWMKAIPKSKPIHDSIKTYKGINLLDYEQRTKYLFPILRSHKLVIDFWLKNVVFPKESKQFPGKLVMNAWDLCYEKQKHPTTGFSGTNDSSLLLPATISQQDLEELKKTNEELEITIQRQENQCKRSLEMGVTCDTILKFMTQDNLRVLIDAGAIVLELGNEALAQRWLDLDPTLEGVVYFTTENELVIKTRSESKESGGDIPLKLSSYRERLENCAVYLDDYHTRGTDLKLPTNFKACVTIGSSMRRDKLVQACMRMRKLGKGQSIQFYLSHEAANKIKEMKKRSFAIRDRSMWLVATVN